MEAPAAVPPVQAPNGQTTSAEMDEIRKESDKTNKALAELEQEILKAEEDYFDATPHGNIVRGWDGFLDSKPPPKRMYVEKERVFTWSSYSFWSKNRQQIQTIQENEEALKMSRSYNASSPREHKAFLNKKRKRKARGDVSDDDE